MPDSDGYPTEEELTRIRDWPSDDPFGWFTFIKLVWWQPGWGWKESGGVDNQGHIRQYFISTGGWSGNEEIIHAMRDNFILWTLTWESHRRGGHYEFRVPRREARDAR